MGKKKKAARASVAAPGPVTPSSAASGFAAPSFAASPAFLARMRALLGAAESGGPDAAGPGAADFAAFEEAWAAPPRAGLRLNLLKCKDAAAFAAEAGFALAPTPFADEGFYVPAGQATGRHPWHHAGLFYLQEPSAMAAVEALAPLPGERVLDLCAAPGGKSTQIAARLAGRGLLVANEVVGARAGALLSNLERCGVANALVYNETPERLCPAFAGFFDAVLVDAPCSGEGMFRREPAAAADWTPKTPAACARRQLAILRQAAGALRPGGRLVYSTCTFAPEENEGVLAAFLRERTDFSMQPIASPFGRPARPDWVSEAGATPQAPTAGQADASIAFARRVLPQDGGEGHFVALLRRAGDAPTTAADALPVDTLPAANGLPAAGGLPPEAAAFFEEQFVEPPAGVPCLGGVPRPAGDAHLGGDTRLGGDIRLAGNIRPGEGTLWLLPALLPVPPAGLRLLRAGLCAGWVKRGRFEPAHALYLAVRPGACRRTVDLPLSDVRLSAFLHGQTLDTALSDGYAAVLAAGHAVGFGKVSGGVLKNHYPRALRLLG